MHYVSQVGSLSEKDFPYTATEEECPSALKLQKPMDVSTITGPTPGDVAKPYLPSRPAGLPSPPCIGCPSVGPCWLFPKGPILPCWHQLESALLLARAGPLHGEAGHRGLASKRPQRLCT
mmetsp:Transcript_79779/g.237648  ORF Transcript_79779/g.237648 Transcript_79779/m.237648 type:complete len:120 (+) Transcript_79779:412-771(+)